MKTQPSVFTFAQDKVIRSTMVEKVRYFSVIDVIRALTGSTDARKYWMAIKSRDPELSTVCRRFDLPSQDGKLRATDCTTEDGLLRIIQSIPSKKVEPFKQWLAKVGRERLEEERNPELGIARASERAVEAFRRQGYSDEWIKTRLPAMQIRVSAMAAAKAAGIDAPQEYAALTNKVHTDAMGVSVRDHKALKGLPKKASLRNHMTEREILFLAICESDLSEQLRLVSPEGYAEVMRLAEDRGQSVYRPTRATYEASTGQKIATAQTPLGRIIAPTTRKSKDQPELPFLEFR